MKKYIVEALGTFALTLTVALSIAGVFPVPTPILAGLVLGLFVYSIGHISGTHINPAVTIGLWSIGKIKSPDALNYIGAQFIGAGLAFFLASSLGDVGSSAGVVIENSLMVFLAEMIGTFFFTFGIASVVFDRTPKDVSGVVIGGSLFLGITIAILMGSNGVLNPAVAAGIGSFGLMYVLGPIVGSFIGMQVYKALEN
jgi:glycerol uptake facilitator-like aquaporin